MGMQRGEVTNCLEKLSNRHLYKTGAERSFRKEQQH